MTENNRGEATPTDDPTNPTNPTNPTKETLKEFVNRYLQQLHRRKIASWGLVYMRGAVAAFHCIRCAAGMFCLADARGASVYRTHRSLFRGYSPAENMRGKCNFGPFLTLRCNCFKLFPIHRLDFGLLPL